MVYPHVLATQTFLNTQDPENVNKYLNGAGLLSDEKRATFQTIWLKTIALTESRVEDLTITEDMLITLKALHCGCTVQELQNHNVEDDIKLDEEAADFPDVEDEQRTNYTGVQALIEKLFGPGTIIKFKDAVDGLQAMDPKEAITLLDWAVDSWPIWKEKAQPYIEKYKPVVEDVVKTIGEVLEPLIDAPFQILMGQGLREVVRDEKEFRKDFRKTLNRLGEFLHSQRFIE